MRDPDFPEEEYEYEYPYELPEEEEEDESFEMYKPENDMGTPHTYVIVGIVLAVIAMIVLFTYVYVDANTSDSMPIDDTIVSPVTAPR